MTVAGRVPAGWGGVGQSHGRGRGGSPRRGRHQGGLTEEGMVTQFEGVVTRLEGAVTRLEGVLGGSRGEVAWRGT